MRQSNIQQILIKMLIRDMEYTRINLQPHYQREPEQWTVEQQSLFIHSIFANYPIPPLYFYENEQGQKDVFDGLQRITSITKFINNELKLHKNTPDYHYSERFKDGMEEGTLVMANKRYSDLVNDTSEQLISVLFDEKALTYFNIEACSDDEQQEIFYRLNNGTKMSNAQKMLATSGRESATTIKSIMTLPIFTRYSCLTPSQKKKGEISNIASILGMMCVDYPCSKFAPSKIGEFTRAVKDKTVDINYADIKDILSEFSGYIDSQYKKIPNFNKWQIIIMSYCFYLLKQQGADVMKFAKWFPSFLGAENQDTDYLNTKSMTKNLCKEKADYVISEFKKEYGGNIQ